MALNNEKSRQPDGSVDAGEMLADAPGAQQSPWTAIGPGTRKAHRALGDTLSRYAHRLDRVHLELYTLRNDLSAAAPWIDWYIDNEYLIMLITGGSGILWSNCRAPPAPI